MGIPTAAPAWLPAACLKLLYLAVSVVAACGGGETAQSGADANAVPSAAPLRLLSSEPEDGAEGVPEDTVLTLTYSDPLKEAPAVVLVGPSGKEVGGVLSVVGAMVTFTPHAPLGYYQRHVVQAEGGVGLSGAVPDPPVSRSPIAFRTAASPTQPAIAWGAQPGLAFSAAEGGPPPAAQSIGVINAGGGVLEGLALADVRYGKGNVRWVAAARLDSATAPATLTVEVDPAGLALGVYFASISVNSPAATNLSQALVLTLEVR